VKNTRCLVAALCLMTTLLASTTAAAVTPVADAVHTASTIIHYVGRVIEIAQKYQQIYNQYQQIANEYQQIAHQLQALEKLDEHFERDIFGAVASMEGLFSGGLVPTHMNPSVQQIHLELFPGWEPPEEYWRDEEKALTAALKTARKSLGAQHQAHKTSVEHLDVLNELKRQVREAEGTEQVLEALAGLAAFQAEVATMVQMSQATSADAPNAYYSYQLNATARQTRAMLEALQNSNLEPPTWEPGSGWGALPSWWR
jgi:P-type conjugative transfer protein TrbJ